MQGKKVRTIQSNVLQLCAVVYYPPVHTRWLVCVGETFLTNRRIPPSSLTLHWSFAPQGGSTASDNLHAVSIGDDQSVVLAGYLGTSSISANTGVVIKLDADGQELWQWESVSLYESTFYAVAIGSDGSIIAAGLSNSDDDAYYAIKLDEDGTLQWQYEVQTFLTHEYGTTDCFCKSVLVNSSHAVKTVILLFQESAPSPRCTAVL